MFFDKQLKAYVMVNSSLSNDPKVNICDDKNHLFSDVFSFYKELKKYLTVSEMASKSTGHKQFFAGSSFVTIKNLSSFSGM